MIYEWVHALASSLAQRAGYRIIKEYRFPRSNGSLLDLAISVLRAQRDHIAFVQIGANDGVLHDPLRSHLCQGGFVGALCEPIPELYEILKVNCASYRDVQFLNVAVSDADGVLVLHLPRDIWNANHHQKASCDIANMAKVGIAEKDLVALEVGCLTLSSVLRRIGIKQLDLLVVDAEGHDFAIIKKGFDDAIEPAVIFLEVIHLKRLQRLSLRVLFEERGYFFFEDLKDCLAIKRVLLQ